MEKKYIDEIIKNGYKKWKKGDLVFIDAGTGKGKSYFIKNKLNSYAKDTGRRILYLTNRENLRKQIENDIGIDSNIKVINYQKVETLILNNNITLNSFDYVIMDEAHYFFTDASFNCKTDLFFKKVLGDNSICKIMMTATPMILLNYLKNKDIEINYQYELKTDYSYIDKIVCFNNTKSIDAIVESIAKDEQIIYFGSAKRALELCRKYNGAFVCSEYNKDGYYKYVDKGELDNIIKNGKFIKHLLGTTTALDNGINITEFTDVKHIIIEIFDRDTFIQVLGRKRIGEGEKINLYFNSYNNKQKISGFMKKITNSLERVDYLREKGQVAYMKKSFKNNNFTDTRIIDEISDEVGHGIKIVNECMYEKYISDFIMCDVILNKNSSATYKSIIALNLGINEDAIIDMEQIEEQKQKKSLEEVLDSIVGQRLYKEQQKELAEFVNIKRRGKLMKSHKSLNSCFDEEKIDYYIKSYTDWDRKVENGKYNENYGKTYWVIYKLVDVKHNTA